MEEFGGPRFETIKNTIRKKRSQTSRRPRPESLQFPESRDRSPLSSATPSDDVGKISSDENPVGDTSSRRKLFNLNQCALRETISRAGEYPLKKINKDGLSSISHRNGDFKDSVDRGGSGLKHMCRDDENQSPGYPRINGHGVENDNKVKNVKLKVGDATRTIQTKSNSHGASGSGSSTKVSRMSEAPRSRHKMILQQENSDVDDHSPPVKKTSLRGIPWKDFSGGSSDRGVGTMPKKTASANRGEESEPVRKSKRVPKRRVLEGTFDEEDEDDEIRYLEKLKISKAAAGSKVLEEGSSKKRQRISRVSKSDKHDEILEDFAFSKSSKDGKKKSQLEKGSEDTDYEEELVSDGEHEGTKKKKPKNDSIDSPIESKRGLALTTRQRALLSSKDASTGSASVVEFPNGLPPAPPRRQKEQLSEVEQQLKKAEATQRRRMQVEKAARESEAEAIRKILGQDSSRKKREDKIKKRQEEIQQEKAANALVLASNTVRLVMGPTGTVVTFSNDMGLPSIFDPKSCSYPPPREKCSGPSCTNPYKYRDSKSKLPLCSLQCYKAIHEKMQAETTS